MVVAKCPIPGLCKTRLIPLLGEVGAAVLAKAMLKDVVMNIHQCPAFRNVSKILLYAAPTVPETRTGGNSSDNSGFEIMNSILRDELKLQTEDVHRETVLEASLRQRQQQEEDAKTKSPPLPSLDANDDNPPTLSQDHWYLLPMLNDGGDISLRGSSDLSAKLEDALNLVRAMQHQMHSITCSDGKITPSVVASGTVFVGMDAPVLSLEDIVTGLEQAKNFDTPSREAMLCPAEDGGYGMLCVPPAADSQQTFARVLWSHPLTALSQIKALTDQNIMVTIGKVMQDIDDPEDVRRLCQLLKEEDDDDDYNNNGDGGMSLTTAMDHCNLKYVSSETDSTKNNKTIITRQRVSTNHPPYHYTRKALIQAGLLSE